MSYFYYEESPYSNGFILRPNFDNLRLSYTVGSFSILPARLLGLTYANYLRYCRDAFQAKLTGKNNLYPIPYFQNKEKLEELIRILEINVEKVFEKERKKKNG